MVTRELTRGLDPSNFVSGVMTNALDSFVDPVRTAVRLFASTAVTTPENIWSCGAAFGCAHAAPEGGIAPATSATIRITSRISRTISAYARAMKLR
jgi:hypothetical protein